MAASEEHQFNRRITDVNMAALADRMQGLEGRVAVLEEQGRTTTRSLTDNTTLTREVHAAVFGEGDKPGVQQLVQNISDIIETGRGFFRGIGRMASGVGKASDFVSRNLRRFWWVIALAIACATYLKTGKWELPVWPG